MKKKVWIIMAVAVALLVALFVPYRIDALDDGGTREYCALTYRVVAWNRVTEDGCYEKTRVYFLGDVFASIDELWEREEPNMEHRFIATVLELNGTTVLVEPVEYEQDRCGSRVSFDITSLPDIEAEVGSVVRVTYRGGIRETYPAAVDATGWEITRDLRHMEYTGTWLDPATTEKIDSREQDLIIEEIYADCFFAVPVIPMPGPIKINGTLSDEWCVGDQVLVTFKNYYHDKDYRYEGDLESITESDFELDPNACYKPVIYLYPEEEMEVSVKLALDGGLTCTYPAYGNGWTVTAQPDGTLTDGTGQTYSYLYWEGETNARFDFSEGFCVRGADTAAFLEDALDKLGLTRREANEFIVYWLPLMEANAYNVISFQADTYTEAARLEIEPAPDTLIRVFMAWTGSDAYVELEEQELTALERSGFTAVEWGGTEIG